MPGFLLDFLHTVAEVVVLIVVLAGVLVYVDWRLDHAIHDFIRRHLL